VPTFVDRGVSRGQRGGSPTVVNLSFLDRNKIGIVDLFMADGKSFIYSKNNKGPKTELCGTPCLILDQFDAKEWPLDLTFNIYCLNIAKIIL
jgi:hypothetical protein